MVEGIWITNDAKGSERHERGFRGFRALAWVSCSRTTADTARHDKMVVLVERLLALHKKLAADQAAGISQVLVAGMLDEGPDIGQTRQI